MEGKQVQQAPPRINQKVFGTGNLIDRFKVYGKTLPTKKQKLLLVLFLVPGILLLPIKAGYNLFKKSWDYASDFFVILFNIR